MEVRRGSFPLCPFKRGATGAEVPFHHRCRSRQIFGVQRILPEFPQTCPKSFCAIYAYKFSPTKIMKTSFWCNLQKKVFMFFHANLGRRQTTLDTISTRIFRAFAQIFSKSKLLRVRLQPLHPDLKHHCFS